MSLVSDVEVLDYLSISDGGTPAANAIMFRDGIEGFLSKYCRRVLESTTYTLDRYNGSGTKYLRLNAYPITALYRLSVGKDDAIRIKNTLDNSSASVSVNSTGIVLERNGTVNSSCTFAAYSTITLIVAAINAVGSGWFAEVVDYASYASSNLLTRFGANANDSNDIYLYIPQEAEDEFEVNEDTGVIYLPNGFPKGTRNIYVSFTGGYTESTLPVDLKMAILSTIKYGYNRYSENIDGVLRYTAGDIEMWMEESIVKYGIITSNARTVLANYKRILI